jgi:hypothetical protein
MTEDRQLNLLKDMRVLTVQTVEQMIEGCRNIKEDKTIHKDAKDLATLVIKDCNNLLMFIKENADETTT